MAAITPEECIKAQENIVPDAIIDVFNDIIKISWNGDEAFVGFTTAREKLYENTARNPITEKYLSKIAIPFKQAGWEVREGSDGWRFIPIKGV